MTMLCLHGHVFILKISTELWGFCVYLIDVVAQMGQPASLVMEKCAFNEHKEDYSLFRAFACCLDPVLKSTP